MNRGMRGKFRVIALSAVFASALACKKEEAASNGAAQESVAKTSSTPASAAAPTGTPVTGGYDPFQNGDCELSVNGAPAKKEGGDFSSARWGDGVPWGVRIACGGLTLLGYGDESEMPMAPGSYPHYQAGGPKTKVVLLRGNADHQLTGELKIESFDAQSIKGVFEGKGSVGVPGESSYQESVSIRLSFSQKKRSTPHTPFKGGYCEFTVDDGPPIREPGNQFALSSGHWAAPKVKSPSWPLLLNCGKYSFSAEGSRKDVPMKPGKYQVKTPADPGQFSMTSPLALPRGELTIAEWTLGGIKGSFEIEGPVMFAKDTKPRKVKGSFDMKCPMTASGECEAAP